MGFVPDPSRPSLAMANAQLGDPVGDRALRQGERPGA
jgi:hypothetical protein